MSKINFDELHSGFKGHRFAYHLIATIDDESGCVTEHHCIGYKKGGARGLTLLGDGVGKLTYEKEELARADVRALNQWSQAPTPQSEAEG